MPHKNIFSKLKKIDQECSKIGFSYNHHSQLIEQLKSEIREVEEVIDQPEKQKELEEEIGDTILAAIDLCLFLKFDPESLLRQSAEKFERRFKMVEKLANEKGLENLHGQELEKIIALWKQAKKLVG